MAENLNYSEEEFEYTDEFKEMLDARYEECLSGKVQMISAEESQKRINELLAGKKKPDAF